MSINERLSEQRLRARQALQRVLSPNHRLRSDGATQPSITPGLERTDYVPYRRYDSINISDLMMEKTVDLQLNSPAPDDKKCSFEPSEITGRSTMCTANVMKKKLFSTPSVDEILATSCFEDVRSLGASMRESYSGAASSMRRTADMSSDSIFPGENRNNLKFSVSFCNESCINGESFTSASKMMSKLEEDEMEWQMEYATIPNTRQTASSDGDKTSDKSILAKNPAECAPSSELASELSIGNFFQKRSDDIFNIIQAHSPTKIHQPIALFDGSDEVSAATTLSSEKAEKDIYASPIIENKTYTKNTCLAAKPIMMFGKESFGKNNNSPLSLSAIHKVFDEEFSVNAIVKKFVQPKRFLDSIHPQPLIDITDKRKNSRMYSLEVKNKAISDTDKELIALSDTVSATDSILKDFNEWENMPPTITHSSHLASEIKKSISRGNLYLKPPIQEKLTMRRKRSHSSTRPDESTRLTAEICHYERRSKSPANRSELTAASGSIKNKSSQTPPSRSPRFERSTSLSEQQMLAERKLCRNSTRSPNSEDANDTLERIFLLESKSQSPNEIGKYSLPSYGINSRCNSPMSLRAMKSRCNSQCSASSEYSHRDGKAPLKSTASELSWASIKLRRSANKSFQIKNTSYKRLLVRIEISGPGFQIVAASSSDHTSLITMQSQECRTICVSFCPTIIGAAIGKLTFYPPFEKGAVALMAIVLYGYGGHSNISLQGVLKGPIGSAFLPMGELRELARPLEQTVIIYNKGPLTGFACLLADSIGLTNNRACDAIEITPQKVIIPPESYVKILIKFRPRRDDIKKIVKKICDVMTIANLRIIYGDEVTRQRIRNLILTMKSEEQSKMNVSALEKVWNKFPNEKKIEDLGLLKEKSEVALDFVATLKTFEISLTLNHTMLNDTTQSTLVFPDIDETVMFKTINGDQSQLLEAIDENDSSELWSVRPGRIRLDTTELKKVPFFVHSNFSTGQFFEIASNYNHLFKIYPKSGILPSGEDMQIEISLQTPLGIIPSGSIELTIYLENEKITIPVIIT